MMGDFACMEMEWDLGAVVRKSCSSEAFAFADIMANPPYLFAPPLRFGEHHQDDQLLNFPPDFFSAPDFHGLEGIYNEPFCYPQSMLITNPTSKSALEEVEKEPERGGEKRLISDAADSVGNTTGDAAIAKAHESRRGRRNQHKRVVQHVAADDLSNDIWAWRKYGQKPIKGSPHPRSYYRCSSLKGCPARRHVERSCSDPSTFIVTYTAEHKHPRPPHRSALAGTTRTKLPTTNETVASPKTPSMASIEDEVAQRVSIKTDREVEKVLEDSTSGNSNLVFPDELFPSLDDFEGLLFDEL